MKSSSVLVRVFALVFAVLTTGLASNSYAENWPGWRGPRHNGISGESNVPIRWSSKENIHWEVPVPGVGHSSPIVWDDAIFVTTCLPKEEKRLLICYDRESGNERWRRTTATCAIETMHRDNTPASATPVTDGACIFVAFQVNDSIQVTCYTVQGAKLWQVSAGKFESRHGFCTSLVLDDDMLFVSGLQDGPDAFVAALDPKSGRTIWKVPRAQKVRSFSSPLPCTIGDQSCLLLSGANQTVSYDPSTGRVIWQTDGPAEKTVSSIVTCPDSNLAFVCGGRDNGFLALDLTSSTTPRHAWETTKGLPYMTSPLATHGYLHILSDEGVYRCYESRTGKIIKQLRAVGPVRASMVATNEHIYITEKNGKTTVIKNDPTWTVVAENTIDEMESTPNRPAGDKGAAEIEAPENVMASAAISNGDFILRTTERLILIRQH